MNAYEQSIFIGKDDGAEYLRKLLTEACKEIAFWKVEAEKYKKLNKQLATQVGLPYGSRNEISYGNRNQRTT